MKIVFDGNPVSPSQITNLLMPLVTDPDDGVAVVGERVRCLQECKVTSHVAPMVELYPNTARDRLYYGGGQSYWDYIAIAYLTARPGLKMFDTAGLLARPGDVLFWLNSFAGQALEPIPPVGAVIFQWGSYVIKQTQSGYDWAKAVQDGLIKVFQTYPDVAVEFGVPV